MRVELPPLRDGVSLAISRNTSPLDIELDSLVVGYLLSADASIDHPLASILLDCRQLL